MFILLVLVVSLEVCQLNKVMVFNSRQCYSQSTKICLIHSPATPRDLAWQNQQNMYFFPKDISARHLVHLYDYGKIWNIVLKILIVLNFGSEDESRSRYKISGILWAMFEQTSGLKKKGDASTLEKVFHTWITWVTLQSGKRQQQMTKTKRMWVITGSILEYKM